MKPVLKNFFTGLLYNGRLLALPANIRLGFKRIAAANTLAYCERATITV